MSYSDIISNGGMDPRSRVEDSMYRLTIAQRDSAWREVDYWRERHNKLLKMLADNAGQLPPSPPPVMLAEKESYEAGRVKGKADAAEELREECAQVVEAMGMQGYGTLAIAAAIRKGQA